MQEIWKKLNFKDHTSAVILNAPTSFESTIAALENVEVIRAEPIEGDVNFFLFFVQEKSKVTQLTSEVLLKTSGDVVAWFCYPKASSKNYSCDFNRDNGWDTLTENGFGGVRQVAIDQDWSALRFRRTEFIKSRK